MNRTKTKESQSFLLFKMKFRFIFVIATLVAISFFVSATLARGKTDRIKLSSEEAAWLTTHPVIFHAPDPDYSPFEFKDSTNHYAGIAPDFLKLVGIKLGVQFKEVPSPSWNVSLYNVKQHKADLVTVATKTPERSEYMLFTSPYIEFRNVILMREDISENIKTADLGGKTIAAIKGWAITTYIQNNFPDIKLLWVPNVKEALKSVSSGAADAVLLNRATSGYWRAKTDITNLRIVGETDYSYKLSFASRKDWPQLNRLLEKALNNISESERRKIVDKWIFPFRQDWRPGPYFYIALAGAIVLLLVVGIFFWIVSLRQQVQSRTVDLQTELTERKQAEEALRDSENKYRTLTESIPDIIYSIDKDGKIVTINPQAENLFGDDSDKLIGNHISAFIHPKDKDMYLKAIIEGIKKHKKHIRGLEFGIVGKNGATRWVEMHSHNQFDEHGNFRKQDGVLRDNTETKLLQDQLIRSERLAATGQLAASVAHEINSPLQGITSLISVIKESYDKDVELLENIELIEGGFKRVRNTVKNLLDLNRQGSEQKQLSNINAIINDTLSLVKVLLKKNKIEVDLNLSPRVPDILASPQQLGYVFINLINNAVEAMTGEHKGKGWKKRTAVSGEIRINTRLKKEEVIIEVADTGPGIPKEHMGNIFDPFYTRKKTMGIGIGLSICHGIIEDHKGSIVAKNLPEGGAVFKITLPVN